MSGFIRRVHVTRLVVLAAIVVLALTGVQLASTSRRAEAPQALAEPPAMQQTQPGSTLVPSATPLPAPVPAPAQVSHRKRTDHGARKHRARLGRGARTAHRPPSRWRSSGGRDIGWPQCPHDVGFRGRNGLGQPMPDPGVRFVVVGLTNGRSFTPNPCLDRHLEWVRSHHAHAAAYAFATYPTRAQLRRYRHRGPYDGRRILGALANVGAATARYNVHVMRDHGFETPHVWLDVEPSSSRPWSRRSAWNRALVRGWVRGYRDAGYTVGIYSTTHLWRSILGPMRLRLPEWRTAGPVSPRAALRKCRGESIQGGPPVIAQWWTAHRDFDRLCPGASPSVTLARYFHQW